MASNMTICYLKKLIAGVKLNCRFVLQVVFTLFGHDEWAITMTSQTRDVDGKHPAKS